MSSSYFMLKFLRKKRKNIQNAKLQSVTRQNIERDSNILNINKCRICLKDGTIAIFNANSSFDMSEAVRTYGGIELSEYDDFPNYLCKSCHTFLQKAAQFKRTAQNTDRLLRETVDQTPNLDDDFVDQGSIETTPKSFICKLCKLNFDSWDEYAKHRSSKRHKTVRIQCPVCYGLLTTQLYERHLARHQTASHLLCDVCGKLYRKDNLIRHLQLHSYELPFHCQICPYKGRFMESLRIHMRTHSGEKPFSCDKCDLRFLTRSNLNRHLLTHKKEKPFKCVECGRGFYTKRDMEVHFKADHAGVKDFSCRLCGNKYSTRKALMRHELRVHKRDKMAKGRMPLYLQAEYQMNDAI